MPTREFQAHNTRKISVVISTSLFAYLLMLYLSFKMSEISYYWVLLLAIPTHFFHARMFIVMHDCGHYSFFKNKFMNNLFGHLTSFYYFVPFFMWRELHNKHHAFQGNLDKRDRSLDVWTMTTEEYKRAPFYFRSAYRFYRNPVVLLVFAPLILFFLIFRIPFEKFSKKAILNILFLDVLLLIFIFYFREFTLEFLKIQAPSLFISLVMASFLFYVQHQFKNTIWLRNENFSNSEIALRGSSYLKLPAFLNWAYGNIGYHHIHHLDVRVPMYNLPQAQKELSHEDSVITIADAIRSFKLKVWDEKSNRLQRFY